MQPAVLVKGQRRTGSLLQKLRFDSEMDWLSVLSNTLSHHYRMQLWILLSDHTFHVYETGAGFLGIILSDRAPRILLLNFREYQALSILSAIWKSKLNTNSLAANLTVETQGKPGFAWMAAIPSVRPTVKPTESGAAQSVHFDKSPLKMKCRCGLLTSFF